MDGMVLIPYVRDSINDMVGIFIIYSRYAFSFFLILFVIFPFFFALTPDLLSRGHCFVAASLVCL